MSVEEVKEDKADALGRGGGGYGGQGGCGGDFVDFTLHLIIKTNKKKNTRRVAISILYEYMRSYVKIYKITPPPLKMMCDVAMKSVYVDCVCRYG